MSESTTSASGWTVQRSAKTGRQYWFNTKTGVSTYEPPEVIARSQAAVATGGGAAVHPLSQQRGHEHRPMDDLSAKLSSSNPVDFTSAAEIICKRVAGLCDATDDSAAAQSSRGDEEAQITQFEFPAADKVRPREEQSTTLRESGMCLPMRRLFFF